LELRRFLRGNCSESYGFLKTSGFVEEDRDCRAAAADMQVRVQDFYATADWFDKYDALSPEEREINSKSREYGLERARRARGGRTLEDVEDERRHSALEVQGPSVSNGEEGKIRW